MQEYQREAIYDSYEVVPRAAAGEAFRWPPSVDESFEWVDAPDFPGARTHRGQEEVRRFFASWSRYWDEFEVKPQEVIELDAERVLIPVILRFRGKGGGPWGEQLYAHLWEFRDGRAIRLRNFSSVEQAREAA